MTWLDALTALLVIAPAFDWSVAVLLAYLVGRNPDILTMRERFVTAVMLAFTATIAGILALVRFGRLSVSNESAVIALVLAMIAVSVPAVVWLVLLLTGRFRIPNGSKE